MSNLIWFLSPEIRMRYLALLPIYYQYGEHDDLGSWLGRSNGTGHGFPDLWSI